MKSLYIPVVGLLLLFGVQLTAAFRLKNKALTTEDIDVLKLLLQRLDESIPVSSYDQTQTPSKMVEDAADLKESPIKHQPKKDIIYYLSAGNLRTVRKDYPGCFGRKIDRIGSMSSLGCKTVGRSGPKNK